MRASRRRKKEEDRSGATRGVGQPSVRASDRVPFDLRREVGNDAVQQLLRRVPAGSDDRPPLVSRVLDQGGQPLPEETRLPLEREFGQPLGPVRIHTDTGAANSAGALGARAYTSGDHVVFGHGEYAPATPGGHRLLVHELTHVLQNRGAAGRSAGTILPSHSAEERHAVSAESALAPAAPLGGAAGGGIALLRSPQLPERLARVRELAIQAKQYAIPAEQAIELLFDELADIDLTDRENLTEVSETIGATFPGPVLTGFLANVEARFPVKRGPTPEEEAAMQRRLRPMQVGRRGPYGMYGPGVLFPVGAQLAASALLTVAEVMAKIGRVFGAAAAFVLGVFEGLTKSISLEQAQELGNRLVASTVLTVVFPPVFTTGAGVGIIEDVVEAVKGLYELVTNFREIAADTLRLIAQLFSDEGATVAHLLGLEIGKEYAQKIVALLGGNIFVFTFNLGRLIGPMIVYTVLAFLGVPQLVGAAIAARLAKILQPLILRFPRLARLAGKVLRHAPDPHRPRVDVDPEIDKAVEKAFAHTPDPNAPRPAPGVGAVGAPALTRAQIAAAKRLMGRNLRDVPLLRRIWMDVANPGDRVLLTASNSRRLFNNHRRRFWRAVRNDPDARRMFEDAGFRFPAGRTTSPVHAGVPGVQGRFSLDHVTRRASDFTEALEPDNLRFVVHGDNTLLENLQQAIPSVTQWQ